jgi:hypothetical protein
MFYQTCVFFQQNYTITIAINVVKKTSWLLKFYDFTSQHVSTCQIELKLELVKSVKLSKIGLILQVWKIYKIVHSGNMYLNIFIVLNLYLAKLVQYDNQVLDFDYNYYIFF